MKITWEQFLNENYCTPISITGNRPCDNGVLCDACHTIEAQELFIEINK